MPTELMKIELSKAQTSEKSKKLGKHQELIQTNPTLRSQNQ